MDTFFTTAFDRLSSDEREAYHRAVFMHMDTPHAAGLRTEYYRTKLRRMGANVSIGCGVTFVNPQHIALGDDVAIDDQCTLVASSERGISLADGVRLKHRVYLDTEGAEGYIEIGPRVYIGTACCLHGHQGLEIGEDALLAQNITITPYSHRFDDPAAPIIRQGGHTRKITIGRDAYLGMGAIVLWSADVGEGAVVGSGAVVVKPVAPWTVVVGVPARVVRTRGEAARGEAT